MRTDATDVACDGWDGSECEGTIHCPPRCPRFVDKEGDRWTIRPGALADAGALAEMYESFTQRDRAQGLPPVDRDRRVDWLESLLTDGSNVVAERAGELLGHAVYTPTDADRPELAVFVHPEMQDRGVGTELCRHVIADAAVGDREALELFVTTDNHVARHVYHTVGFRVVKREGDLWMELPLDDAVATAVRWPPLAREGPVEVDLDDPDEADLGDSTASAIHPDHNR